MFLKLILDFYDYIKGMFKIRPKQKMDPAINITQIEEVLLNNNKNNEDYNEYNEIEPVTKNPYSRQANSAHSVKQIKSHNELVKIFYCTYKCGIQSEHIRF